MKRPKRWTPGPLRTTAAGACSGERLLFRFARDDDPEYSSETSVVLGGVAARADVRSCCAGSCVPTARCSSHACSVLAVDMPRVRWSL